MTSHETANQVTIGAVARIPKMSPNLRKSMMMSKTASVLCSKFEKAYTSA